MSNDEEKIEELKKKLYSPTDSLPKMKHVKLHDHNVLVNRDWDEKAEQEGIPKIEYGNRGNKGNKFYSFLKGLVVFAVIFLLVAIGVAYYYFKINPNTISSSNIDISVSGPVTVSAGQELDLDVNIFNNNPSGIEAADLIMTYPEGTRSADDKETSLITDRIPIGDIPAGGTERVTAKSILLGEEGSTKNINVALEYKLPGTNSLFLKEKSYPMGIGTGPVSITVDSIKEITPEQNTKFVVSVKSNSSDIIKSVVLKADYPFGFDYVDAEPSPSSSNNNWRLGDIVPGEVKKIEVNAKIFGQANQERTVRFSAGTAQSNDPNSIATTFASFSQTVNLKAPFLGADVAINGSGDEITVANSGQFILGEVLWKNNLDVSIHNVLIEGKLTGSIIDRGSINVPNGFYKSDTDMFYWEKSNAPEMEDVAPSQSGLAHFNMKVMDLTKDLASNLRRPEVTLTFTVKGNRLNENKVSEEITSQSSRKIRIASDLGLSTRLLYNDGPFENTGPMPTKAESRTTYTANVKVSNSYNTVKGAIYTAKLPIYVRWLGNVSPSTASSTVVYDAENRTITWNAGDIAPGTGYITNPKEMSYQVEFLPSLSQINQSPVIINSQRIAGTDSFTNTVDSADGYSLNTQIKEDSKYTMSLDKVMGK
ncbi:MAG: hypothetical protein WCO09_00730 [bacterium]